MFQDHKLDRRCGSCGYRLMVESVARCPECGDTRPISAPKVDHVRAGLTKLSIMIPLGWLPMVLATGLANLAIKINDLELFIFSGFLMLLALITSLAWACGVSLWWTPKVLEMIWALRDGASGPWSGWTKRTLVCIALLLLQLCGATVAFAISTYAFPSYPAGWP